MADEEKPKLTPANENPWYCLATLHGEPDEDGLDLITIEENRIAWNRWTARGLDEETRAELIKAGFPAAELIPHDESEMANLRHLFVGRAGREKELPYSGEAVNFVSVRFARPVYFSGFLFADIDCRFTTFAHDARFDRATFVGEAWFSSAIFSRGAWFSSAHFMSDIWFKSAWFTGIAWFSATVFDSVADFISATFTNDADFSSVAFASHALFSSVTFHGVAYFSSVKFTNDSDFSLARFKDNVWFNSATFTVIAWFSSAIFENSAHFSSVNFMGAADFKNVKFNGLTTFNDAIFKTAVPDFRGAIFHEATEWNEVKWPPPPRNKSGAGDQVQAYQRLKQEMEKLKKHEDELNFFCLELRAKRETYGAMLSAQQQQWLENIVPGKTSKFMQPAIDYFCEVPFPAWHLNWLYEKSCDYGRSIWKPVACLTALFLFSTCLIAISLSVPKAIGLSFANIFSFLQLRRDFFAADTISKFTSWVVFVSAIESILAAILFFLIGLGLRNRFRIK